MIDPSELRPVVEQLLLRAAEHGADNADAIMTHGRSLHVSVRGGTLEDVDNSEDKDIGLRVMVGQRQACVSSSDLSPASLDILAERAVAMARLAPEDKYCGLADDALIETHAKNLELCDPTPVSPDELLARALEIEKAALSVSGVSQAEGCSADWSNSAIYFMTSNGFAGGWASSRHGLAGLAIAMRDGNMERDYDAKAARWLNELPAPETIGVKAGERTIARLGSRQISSGTFPVMFDKRVAGSMVAILLSAMNGNSIARGTSFLLDKMGQKIAAPSITIIDDPLIARGHASRPWDGEGVKVARRELIKQGVLKSWLLNCAAARQLGLQSTGHAYRGMGTPPGIAASNTYIVPGEQTPKALLEKMGEGILITDMFGPSLNPNNGDYSIGIAGFKIEGGGRAFPISEITVAGNILEMLPMMTPANDLEFDSSTVAPSLLIDRMSVSGLS